MTSDSLHNGSVWVLYAQGDGSIPSESNIVLRQSIDDDPRARKIYKELGIMAVGPGG